VQVENDHRSNLRDDQDEIKELVLEVRNQLSDVAGEVTQTKADVSLLKDGYQSNRTRIESLEDTDRQEREQRRTWGPPPTTRRERRDRNYD
jgi:hypothetical protein